MTTREIVNTCLQSVMIALLIASSILLAMNYAVRVHTNELLEQQIQQVKLLNTILKNQAQKDFEKDEEPVKPLPPPTVKERKNKNDVEL